MANVLHTLMASVRAWPIRRRLRAVVDHWDDDFLLVMVIVPNVVHLAIPALQLLANYGPVLALGNALRPWELEWLRRECPGAHVQDLGPDAFGRARMITHGEAMELIASVSAGNFGFVDPDCYVFCGDVVNKLKASSSTACMAAPFWLQNDALALDVPDTYFIGINRRIVSSLKKSYGIGFGTTPVLPVRLAAAVASKWSASDVRPHAWKPFFDTAHAVTLAAAVEGLTMERVATQPGEIFHVCGTSYHQADFRPRGKQEMYVLNAHYFHLELIKRVRHERLDQEFAAMTRHYGGSDGLLRGNPEYARSKTHHEVRLLLDALGSRGVI